MKAPGLTLSSPPRLQLPRIIIQIRRAIQVLRPILRTVVLHLVPTFLWLFLFSSGVALLPPAIRPTINVSLLPSVDKFMGSSVHWFSREDSTYSPLDLVAAIPYTLHPILPFVFICTHGLLSKRPNVLLCFALAFGLMNLGAVITHLMFPTAPPWYYLKYGMLPASYDMKSDPAALRRIDEHFNISFYTNMYEEGGKIVFGAWPSLHAAWPYLMARFRPAIPYEGIQMFQWMYMLLVWWAAVYLQHHFAADVIGGVVYAEAAYQIARFVSKRRKKILEEESLPFVLK